MSSQIPTNARHTRGLGDGVATTSASPTEWGSHNHSLSRIFLKLDKSILIFTWKYKGPGTPLLGERQTRRT